MENVKNPKNVDEKARKNGEMTQVERKKGTDYE